MNKKSKVLKIILALMTLLVAVFIILVIALFSSLPSPGQIRKGLFPDPQAKVHSETEKISKSVSSSIATDDKSTPSVNSEPALDSGTTKNTNLNNEKLLDELMDESKPLSTVCGRINSIDQKQIGKMASKEFGKRFQAHLEGESQDPLIASFSNILKFTPTRPSLKLLFEDLKKLDPKDTKDETLMEKAGFYSRAFSAYQELLASKPQMERILDQSYLLMMLGRAIEQKPELGKDNRVHDYCEQIESELNNSQYTDFAKTKEAFGEFLKDAGVDEKSIGFDQKYRTELKYEFSKKNMRFNGGWIEEVLGKELDKESAPNN